MCFEFSLARSPSKDRDLIRLIGDALFVRRWRAPLVPRETLCGHVVMAAILFTLNAEGKCKILITIGARQNAAGATPFRASQGPDFVAEA